MKKSVFILLILLSVTKISQATPKWLKETFGCTWKWDGAGVLKGSTGSMCTYERPMVGDSWLWGSCGTKYYTYSIPCNHNPDFFPIPQEYQGPSYGTIANKMLQLKQAGYAVKPEWCDEGKLKDDEQVLIAAISFRLELAGYSYNPEWQNLVEEPCPVPVCAKEILTPQDHLFVNADCTNDCTISPNPNTGIFTVSLKSYADVQEVQIVRSVDMSIIERKYLPQSATNFNITGYSGSFIVRVITKTSVIVKQMYIQ